MRNEERTTMEQHVGYWKTFVNNDVVILLSLVMDPKGSHGIAVVRVDSEDELQQITTKDPANGLNSYEVYPMRAVTKKD